jgi:hypothetical protein
MTGSRRDDLAILATERNVDGYERVADLVDGDLYYWSSVNPSTYPDYPGKLVELSDAVAGHDGLWIAPMAPGFDARAVGGSTVVERDEGRVLRTQWNGALASSPDALGLISWNEFSENTHIEPSERYGDAYPRLVSELTGARAPQAIDFDSSDPTGPPEGNPVWRLATVGALGALIIGSMVRLALRARSGGGR